MSRERVVLGVDIGGSSIKCCLFHSQTILQQATMDYVNGKEPDAVLSMVTEIVESWNHDGPIGIGFPGLVDGNQIIDAPNMGEEWIGFDLPNQLHRRLGTSISIINDA